MLPLLVTSEDEPLSDNEETWLETESPHHKHRNARLSSLQKRPFGSKIKAGHE